MKRVCFTTRSHLIHSLSSALSFSLNYVLNFSRLLLPELYSDCRFFANFSYQWPLPTGLDHPCLMEDLLTRFNWKSRQNCYPFCSFDFKFPSYLSGRSHFETGSIVALLTYLCQIQERTHLRLARPLEHLEQCLVVGCPRHLDFSFCSNEL